MTVKLYARQGRYSLSHTAEKVVRAARGRIELRDLGEEPESPCVVFGTVRELREYAALYSGVAAWTVWEGSEARLPEPFVVALRRYAAIAVKSRWLQSKFAEAGLASRVIPNGVDCDVWQPVDLRSKTDTFIVYSYANLRKNLVGVDTAFREAFSGVGPTITYKLVTNELDQAGMGALLNELCGSVVLGEWEEARVAKLVARHHAYVSGSFCEGFNLTALEAMACGLPPIVPNYSGVTDFVTEDNGYLVPVDEILSHPGWRFPVIDSSAGPSMVSYMRRVYVSPEEAAGKGEMARKTALQYPWSDVAAALVAMAEEVG